jgi:hypothetical protein
MKEHEKQNFKYTYKVPIKIHIDIKKLGQTPLKFVAFWRKIPEIHRMSCVNELLWVYAPKTLRKGNVYKQYDVVVSVLLLQSLFPATPFLRQSVRGKLIAFISYRNT